MALIEKDSMLYSIFYNKCPHCHEGDFFEDSNPYHFSKLAKMYKKCPVCGQSYTPETGFYFGAAYVSYAISVAIFVTVWVATEVLAPDNFPVEYEIGLILTAIIVLFPLNYRLSRLIWANWFIKYDPNASKAVSAKK
jgi:uncharacterized protein (DUF983 family)